MSSLIVQLGIDRLSHADRIRLYEELEEYLDAEFPPKPSAELRAELDRRIAEFRANPEPGSSFDEIERRILESLSRNANRRGETDVSREQA